MGKEKKKIFEVILDVFAWLSLILAVLLAVTTIFASLSGDNGKEVFGVRMLIVKSDSMSAPEGQTEDVYFNSGDLIFIKKVENTSNLKEGQVITFVSYNAESYGQIITHKIREVKISTSGKTIGYVTYGIRTGVNDQVVVSPESVIGVYSGKLPSVGKFFSFLQTPQGFALSVMIPSVLIIIYFSISVGKSLGKKGEGEEVDYKQDFNELKDKLASLESKIETLVTAITAQQASIPNQGVENIQPTTQDAQTTATQESSATDTSSTSNEDERAKKIPFVAKLLSLDKNIQQVFANVHNALLSYKKVSARTSLRCISYRLGRVLLAKMTVRGKTLKLHLALDVENFNQNVYFQRDLSSVKAYELVPFTVKLKSARGEKNALKLVEELMAKNNVVKNLKFEGVDILTILANELPQQELAVTDVQEDEQTSEQTLSQTEEQPTAEQSSVQDDGEGESIFGKGSKKIPFTEKLLTLDQTVQSFFLSVHNTLASYKKVSARTSFRCISYRLGRILLAKMTVRGKTLKLHLALDVDKFNKNVYFQNDLSSVKAYEQVPFTVKVKSARGVKNAIALTQQLMAQNNIVINGKYEQIDDVRKIAK